MTEKHINKPKRIHRVQCKSRVNAGMLAEVFTAIRRMTKPRYPVQVTVAEKRIKVFTDTGSDINAMLWKTVTKLNPPPEKTKTKIRPHGSKCEKCMGYYDRFVMFKDKTCVTYFCIIPGNVETLLSGPVCEELGIITFMEYSQVKSKKVYFVAAASHNYRQKLINKYPEVFDGVGALKDHQVHFYMNKRSLQLHKLSGLFRSIC